MVKLCYRDLLHGVNLKYIKLDLLMNEINSDLSNRRVEISLFTGRYVKELIKILKPLADPTMLISLTKTYENHVLNIIHFLRENAGEFVYGKVNKKIPIIIDVNITNKAFMANVAYPNTLTIK